MVGRIGRKFFDFCSFAFSPFFPRFVMRPKKRKLRGYDCWVSSRSSTLFSFPSRLRREKSQIIYSSGTLRPLVPRATATGKQGNVRERLTLNRALLDIITDLLRRSAVNLASNAERGSQDLQHGTLELAGHGLVSVAHGAGNVDDLVERDRLRVLDVLLLLAVTRGLLKGSDDERRRRRHDGDGSLSVLDRELDGHTQAFLHAAVSCAVLEDFSCFCGMCTYPVSCCLCDIFTDLLWRQTERTDLRGESGRRSDLTASGTEVAMEILSVSFVCRCSWGRISTYMILISLGSTLGAGEKTC